MPSWVGELRTETNLMLQQKGEHSVIRPTRCWFHVKRTCGGAERQSSFDPCGLLSCRSGWMSAGCEE